MGTKDDDLERRFKANAELQEQLAEARAHPERSVPRPPRRSISEPTPDDMDAAYAEIAASMTPEELAERRAMAASRRARRAAREAAEEDES